MVKGVASFRARMRRIPENVRGELTKQLPKEGDKVVGLMQVLAPVKTGTLRESIKWSWGDADENGISVGTGSGGSQYGKIAITISAGDDTTAREQRRASGTRPSDQKRSGTFTSNVARYQEFGTSKMAANPFFYPGWRAERRRVRANITRAVRRGFQKS